MRRSLAYLLAALSLGGPAQSETGAPAWVWSEAEISATRTYAWAISQPVDEAAGREFPEIQMLARNIDAASGEHSSVLITVDLNCAAREIRPIRQTQFDANYSEGKKTELAAAGWRDIAFMGEPGVHLTAYCDDPAANRPAGENFTLSAAQVWLDGQFPKPKVQPVPPAGGRLELAGTMSSSQDIEIWLETSTLKREGNLVTAWVFEAWRQGWASYADGYKMPDPATWRLYEFECGNKFRVRNTWFAKMTPALELGTAKYPPDSEFSVEGDLNMKSMVLRACNSRPMLFSETFDGNVRELVATRYGAAAAVGVAGRNSAYVPPVMIDLGHTIRLRETSSGFNYDSVWTETSPGSRQYNGEIKVEGSTLVSKDYLYVDGIIGGVLKMRRRGLEGVYAMPFADKKPAGKGIAEWSRTDDTYEWTFVEPVFPAAAPPVPSAPIPAPAVFRLGNKVTLREASSVPGALVYTTVLTRRGSTSVFDMVWTASNGQTGTDIVEDAGLANGVLTLKRQGTNGAYTVAVGSDGKPGAGKASWVNDPGYSWTLTGNE